jgi:hypothetical protein
VYGRCHASRMSSTYWFHVQPGVFFDAFMVEHLVGPRSAPPQPAREFGERPMSAYLWRTSSERGGSRNRATARRFRLAGQRSNRISWLLRRLPSRDMHRTTPATRERRMSERGHGKSRCQVSDFATVRRTEGRGPVPDHEPTNAQASSGVQGLQRDLAQRPVSLIAEAGEVRPGPTVHPRAWRRSLGVICPDCDQPCRSGDEVVVSNAVLHHAEDHVV